MRNIDHETAWKLLNEKDNILILTHRSPDGDAVGSLFALWYILRGLGKNVRCLIDTVSKPLSFVVNEEAFAEFSEECVVTVDLADKKLLLPEHREKYGDRVFLSIDHHQSNTPFAENTLLDSSAAAASEVIFDMLKKAGQDFGRKTAEALYLGISTDTGCFRYSNTTANTLYAASVLVEKGVDNGEINRRVFETKTREYADFEIRAMNSMKMYFEGRCAVIVLTRDMFEETHVNEEDTHSINALPRQIEGVLVGAVIKEKENGVFKVSVRSNEPVSAARICAALGGGGHRLAAGCEIRGTKEEAVEIFLKEAEKAVSEAE